MAYSIFDEMQQIMSVLDDLQTRSESKCELCGNIETLNVYEVPPESDGRDEQCVLLCAPCRAQISGKAPVNDTHWHCLSDSMWSTVPAVQVMAWRMLNRLSAQTWAADNLEMLYLDAETLAWAQQDIPTATPDEALVHIDANGAPLAAGDTVTLIKDLNVKGGGFTAKRGTAVRNISLVHDNAAHIEGRVSGQQIVILTEFVKKSG